MLTRVGAFFGVVLLAICVTTGQQVKLQLRMTAPADKAQVTERPVAQGTVSDAKARVWVIVHPLEVGDFWVQQSVTVRDDGSWKVMLHVGRPGNNDAGKQFEVMTVANPKGQLKEGQILSGWPEAQTHSPVIEVTRK